MLLLMLLWPAIGAFRACQADYTPYSYLLCLSHPPRDQASPRVRPSDISPADGCVHDHCHRAWDPQVTTFVPRPREVSAASPIKQEKFLPRPFRRYQLMLKARNYRCYIIDQMFQIFIFSFLAVIPCLEMFNGIAMTNRQHKNLCNLLCWSYFLLRTYH
jgi:hypothetical protein